VSLAVVFRETALRGLARVRSDDKEAFAQLRRVVAALADQPHPDGARAWDHVVPGARLAGVSRLGGA
jgi:hypothetical protein